MHSNHSSEKDVVMRSIDINAERQSREAVGAFVEQELETNNIWLTDDEKEHLTKIDKNRRIQMREQFLEELATIGTKMESAGVLLTMNKNLDVRDPETIYIEAQQKLKQEAIKLQEAAQNNNRRKCIQCLYEDDFQTKWKDTGKPKNPEELLPYVIALEDTFPGVLADVGDRAGVSYYVELFKVAQNLEIETQEFNRGYSPRMWEASYEQLLKRATESGILPNINLDDEISHLVYLIANRDNENIAQRLDLTEDELEESNPYFQLGRLNESLGYRGRLILQPSAKDGVFMTAGLTDIKTEDLENNQGKAKALIANRVLAVHKS